MSSSPADPAPGRPPDGPGPDPATEPGPDASLPDDRGGGPSTAALDSGTIDPSAPTVLESGTPGGAADATRADRRPASDERFEPVRLHARGGLGLVHVAWDRELGRFVALKEMRPEYTGQEVLRRRFVQEAEINGNLEHPSIVPIYALGEDPDGRPYYAMRFVRGETLLVALERFHREAAGQPASRWAQGVRPLLERLLDVCDAIAYAHSRGVLHRDLKPANILLGRFGETHIIDWGLAKATGRPEPVAMGEDPHEAVVAPASTGDTTPTVAGQTLGSPPYMSPEQADGHLDELDRTTDVYSLGATLYSVLAGRPPASGKNNREILDQVREGRIAPPRAVEPRVPPALDAICRKAMALRPEDRYPTVGALAQDLGRYLADEPVSVHADGPATRALRWARQHRPLVSGLAALLVTGLVALGITTAVVDVQKREARRARDEAVAARGRLAVALGETETARAALAVALKQTEQAHRRAEDHIRLGLDVVDQLVTFGDRQVVAPRTAGAARQELLGRARQFLAAFRAREPEDVAVRVDSALAARRLAHLEAILGRFEAAESGYRDAAAQVEALRRGDPASARFADMEDEIRLDLASLLASLGRLDEAEALARAAADAARTRASARADERVHRRTLGRALSRRATIDRQRGRAAEALPAASEAAGLLKPLADAGRAAVVEEARAGRYHALTDQLEWAEAVAVEAETLADLDRPAESEARLEPALERLDELVRRFRGLDVPDVAFYHAFLASQRAQRRLETPDGLQAPLALLDLGGAIGRLEDLVRRLPDYVYFRSALAEALAARARAFATLEQDDPARIDARTALGHLDTLDRDAPGVPDHDSLRGAVLETLARLALRSPKPAEARPLLDQAREAQDRALAVNPANPTYLRRQAHLRDFPPVP